jgi:GntR family transcriptional regulator
VSGGSKTRSTTLGRQHAGRTASASLAAAPLATARTEPLPLYHRIYLLLRQGIVEGEWPPDSPMPGEHEISEAHGVSRITVRRALQQLEQEGLVLRRRGAGTFAQRPKLPKRRENLRGLFQNLLAMGAHTEVKLLEFGYVSASPPVAAALGVQPGTTVQKSVRLRSAKGVPFSHLTAWVPEEIGRHYGEKDLAVSPLLHLLEEAGAPPVRAEQVISAKLADSVIAPLLGIEAGNAMLWVRRQVFDETGRVIEVIEALYRPEMYEYQIGLVREGRQWDVSLEAMNTDISAAF